MRMLIGVIALCLAPWLTSCASASPPLEVETEYITQIVEAPILLTADQARAPEVCPAILAIANGDLTDALLGCAAIAAANAGQVLDLQTVIGETNADPPDIIALE